MKGKNLAAIMASFVMAATLAGCANSSASNDKDENFEEVFCFLKEKENMNNFCQVDEVGFKGEKKLC